MLIVITIGCFHSGYRNHTIIDEYQSARVIEGKFESLTEKKITNKRPWRLTLQEYEAVFLIGKYVKSGFDLQRFLKQVEVGDRIQVHISHEVDLDENNPSVSQVKKNDISFVNEEKRDSARRVNGAGGIFMGIVFIGGLIHHQLNPWT